MQSDKHRHAMSRCAVLAADDAARRAAVDRLLEGLRPQETREYASKDDDELNEALCAGQYDTAVFADLDALLQSVFRGHAEPLRWRAAGVRIELAEPPPGPEEAWRAALDQVCAVHARWRAVQRRMRIVSGVILSAIALAAMAILFFLVPGRR